MGKVIAGLGLGAKLGYPTANLEIYRGSTSGGSTSGVYAGRVVVDGKKYKCAVAVRGNLAEVFLFDFQGDLYGQELEVELIKKVSEIKKFDDQEDLIKKIKTDIELCSRV